MTDELNQTVNKLVLDVAGAAPQGIMLINTEGTIVWCNPAILRLFGYEMDELVGANVEVLLPSVLRETHTQHRSSFFKKPSTRPMGSGNIFVAQRSDGSDVEIEVGLGFTQAGDSGLAIAFVTDMTRHQGIVHQLSRLTHSLEVEVRARTRQLREKTRFAEAANNQKTRFIAGVSHEIRTPMNGIVGAAELLRSTDLDSTQMQLVNALSEASDHLLNLINNVLDLSKFEAKAMQVNSEVFNLRELLESTLRNFRPLATSTNVTMSYHDNIVLPLRLSGDPVKLRQILSNMISNAIKFSDPQKGASSVRISALRDLDGTFHFIVQDNGIGMSREGMAAAFRPYAQAHEALAKPIGGTGLGLVLSRELALLMGGELFIESQKGIGTTATLSIKLQENGQLSEYATDLSDYNFAFLGSYGSELERIDEQLGLLGVKLRKFTKQTEILELVKSSSSRDVFLMHECPSFDNERWRHYLARISARSKIIKFSANSNNIAAHSLERVVECNPIQWSQLFEALGADFRDGLQGKMRIDSIEDEKIKRVISVCAERPLMICEDNQLSQDILSAQLKASGLNYQMFSNGREALEGWAPGEYSCLLTDLQMPQMDGLSLLKEIRSIEKDRNLPEMPAILMTAGDIQEFDMSGFGGFCGTIRKPTKFEYLRSELAGVILKNG